MRIATGGVEELVKEMVFQSAWICKVALVNFTQSLERVRVWFEGHTAANWGTYENALDGYDSSVRDLVFREIDSNYWQLFRRLFTDILINYHDNSEIHKEFSKIWTDGWTQAIDSNKDKFLKKLQQIRDDNKQK